jgi:hypothetical protein
MLTLCPPSQDTEVESGAERRRGARFKQTHPIKVYEPGISRYFGGQTQDVSSTGLRLELPSAMPVRPGRLVSVHVGLSEQGQPLANRRQMIPARIVWVDRSADHSCRTISAGIEFLASISAQLDAA